MKEPRPTVPRDAGGAAPHPVSPRLRWASEVIWRTGVLVAAAVVVGLVLWNLKVVVLPIFIAVLLCTALTGPVVALEKHGWPSALAAATVFVAFLVVVVGALVLVVPPGVDGVGGFDSATAGAVDDVEEWLVEGPLGLEREEVRKYTSDPAGQVIDLVQDSSISITSGARMIGETLVGTLLTLVLTFFFLKDGRRFQQWILTRLHGKRELVVRKAAERAWSTFGGYLRGAATLGAVEGALIGTTVWLVGAPLALPIGVITFMAAFFPIVGAVVAGGLAVLVTLASAGVVPALIVLGVAIAVQQLDSDLLGPWIYGQALEIHPVTVLLILTAGGALGGIVGAFVAVPLAAAGAGAAQEFWKARSVVDGIGSHSSGSPDTASGGPEPGQSEPDGGGG